MDRLMSLRHSQDPSINSTPYDKRRREVLIGVIVITLGIALVVFLVVRPTSPTIVAQGEVQPAVSTDSTLPVLLAGEAFLALSLKPGHFPQGLTIGDIVQIAVTPGIDGNSQTKILSETAVISNIADDVENGFTVLTVRAQQSVLSDIASSGDIFVAQVSEAK